MGKLKINLLRCLIVLIINVILLPLCMPIVEVFSASTIQMSLTTSDTRTTFSAGDTIVFNLNIDTIDSAISTIQAYLNFDTSLLEVFYDEDYGLYNITGTRIWGDAAYDSNENSIILETTSSSGSNRTGTIQTIEFKLKKSASISEIAILIDSITASGGQGDLRDIDDVEYGDVTSLRNNNGSGNSGGSGSSSGGTQTTADVQFSLITDDTRTSFSAGDTITLQLRLDSTDAAMTTIHGFLDFDTTLIEIVYDEDYGLYNIIGTRIWGDGEYDDSDNSLLLNSTNTTSGSSATGVIQTIEIRVKRATTSLSFEFNDITVSGGQGDLREAVCTPYSIGNDEPAQTHTVIYDYGTNGGTSANGNVIETADFSEGSSITLPTTYTKSGYELVGWNTSASATTANTSISMGTTDMTIYAIYKKDIEITFKSCNGLVPYTHPIKPIATFYNNNTSSAPISFPTAMNCTKDNATWVHVGWTTSTNASDPGTNKVLENTLTSVTDGQTEFYMVYSRTITISYLLNGNNDTYGSAPSSQSGTIYLNSNSVANVGVYKPTINSLPTGTGRYGYTFASTNNWNTSANGSGTAYTAGTTPTAGFTDSTKLYAQWTANTNISYKIKYYKQNVNDLSNYIEQTADEETKNDGTTGESKTISVNSNKYGAGYELNSSLTEFTKTITAVDGPDGMQEFKVYYSIKGDRHYKVERYLENGDNLGTYTLDDTDEYDNGMEGQNITAPTRNYAGYTGNYSGNEASGIVQADNSLVLKVYYTANDTNWYIDYYKQNWDGTWPANPDSSLTDTRTGKTGASVNITSETKKTITGYSFDSSSANNLQTETINGNGNTRLKLYYTADDVTYNVEHYLQDLNGEYNLDNNETETITAKTGKPVTATAKQSILDRGYVEDTTNSLRVTTGTVVAPNGTLTLKVYYKILLTVTLDSNDGTNAQTSFQVPYGDTYGSNILTNLTRTGYVHTGWSKVADDDDTLVSTSRTVTTSHTLYAFWAPEGYMITFNSLGGSSVPTLDGEYNATYAQYYTNGFPEPTKTGYHFDGWYSDVDNEGNATGTQIQLTDTITGTRTLYAKWTFIPTVIFNINCSDSTIQGYNTLSREVIVGQPYGSLDNPTRTGYDFEGWYTKSDWTQGTKVEETTIVTDATQHTLYARWDAKQYTITFDKNTDYMITVTPSSKPVTFGSNYGELPDLTNAITGYTFDGWYRKNTNGNFVGNSIVATDKVEVADNETFYAKWRPQQVVVIFKYVEPDTTNPEAHPEGIEKTVNLNFEYDTQLNTDKLRTALSAKGLNLNDIIKNSDGTPKTFNTPKYKYTVGSPSIDFSAVTGAPQYGRLTDLENPTIVPVNYNKEIRKYDVTFYDDDRTTILGTVTDVEYGTTASDSEIPKLPKQDNGNIYNWSLWKNVEDNSIVTFPYIVTKPVSVYAAYTATAIDYTVEFLNDDGTQISIKEDYHYNDAIIIPNNPSKASTQQYTYRFKYWIDESGNHPEESSGQIISTTNVDKNKTFTAVYEAVTRQYKVTFYADDGNTILDEDIVDYGSNAQWNRNNDKQIPRKADLNGYAYTFDNAWLKQDRETIDDLSNVIEDRSVYPKFRAEAIQYTITYRNLMGATYNSNPVTYTIEDEDIILEDLDNRPGLIFMGWYETEEYLTQITTINTSEQRNIEVFAKWEVEDLMYFVKAEPNIDNNSTEVMIFGNFEEAKDYVNTLFDNGNGPELGVYDLNNDLVYFLKKLYYVKNSADIDNDQAMQFDDFDEAKNYVDMLFEQGTTIRIYDINNKLVYEPKEEQITEIKYFVKVNSSDLNTDENTFESFSQAKERADELIQQGVKVYDINGEVVYIPEINEEPEKPEEKLYLRTTKYRIGENNITEYEKDDIYFYRIDPYMTLSDFIKTYETNGDITIYKQTGERLKDDEYVGTGMILKDEKDSQYILLMLSIKGDIDGDGEITATDLAAMKQEVIKDIKVSGSKLLAADLNMEDDVTASDLAILNQAILKELDLSLIN